MNDCFGDCLQFFIAVIIVLSSMRVMIHPPIPSIVRRHFMKPVTIHA